MDLGMILEYHMRSTKEKSVMGPGGIGGISGNSGKTTLSNLG